MDQVSSDAKLNRATERTPWRLLALLMAMTAIGPTSLQIIVPALPNLSAIFATSPDAVQLAVSLFLAGLAGAQLFMGPLSDRFGRRPVALGGLTLATVASLAAATAPDVTTFIAARIVQAIGAATGLVVARAIIRDVFDRERSAAMLGLVATAMVVAPMIAPLIGGVLETLFGWNAIFLFVAALSFAVLIWVAVALPETRDLHPAHEGDGFFVDIRHLGRDRLFNGYVACVAFGSATFFAFLGGASHVVVTMMGRTSAEYGVWFAVFSLGYMSGNFVASRLSVRLGIDRMIVCGLAIEAAGAIIGIAASTAHAFGPAILFLPQIITSFGNGIMMPNAIAGAVSVRPHAAGTASGVLGCAQMAIGAAFAQLGGLVLVNAETALPLAGVIAGAVVAFALALVLLVRRR